MLTNILVIIIIAILFITILTICIIKYVKDKCLFCSEKKTCKAFSKKNIKKAYKEACKKK